MENLQQDRKITALADGELPPEEVKEVKEMIEFDKGIKFSYEVQLIISKSIKTALIKHPVSFKLHKKLVKLSSGSR
jgi:hypothetical protein